MRIKENLRIAFHRSVNRLQRLWQRTIGMRLAVWISDRHPELCWGDLCTELGMGWNLFHRYEKWTCGNRKTTKQDVEEGCGKQCYCGLQTQDEGAPPKARVPVDIEVTHV